MSPRREKYYPTQLETFQQCPFKYRCSRDPEIRDKYRRPTPQLYMGTCIHDALEAFFDIRRVPVGQRTLEKLGDLLRRAWAGVDLSPWKRDARRREREIVFGGDREEEASWGKLALTILERYYRIADRTVIPFTAEQFHEAPLAEDVILAGKIDRIDQAADGSLEVIDYKTGKLPWRRDEESLAQEDLQLSSYAIVVGRKYRIPVSRCSLVFLAHDETLGFTPSPELLAAKGEEILGIVSRIRAEREWAPRENPLCPWCEYREICPVGKEIPSPEERPAEKPDVPF